MKPLLSLLALLTLAVCVVLCLLFLACVDAGAAIYTFQGCDDGYDAWGMKSDSSEAPYGGADVMTIGSVGSAGFEYFPNFIRFNAYTDHPYSYGLPYRVDLTFYDRGTGSATSSDKLYITQLVGNESWFKWNTGTVLTPVAGAPTSRFRSYSGARWSGGFGNKGNRNWIVSSPTFNYAKVLGTPYTFTVLQGSLPRLLLYGAAFQVHEASESSGATTHNVNFCSTDYSNSAYWPKLTVYTIDTPNSARLGGLIGCGLNQGIGGGLSEVTW